MAYTVKDADGNAIAGDSILDDMMRQEADRVGGWIEDDNGHKVYP